MDTRLLEAIGLTEGETKVYMALLELGTTTTGPVVKKSGVSASKVYEILNKLAEKGLVSHIIKAKTKYFRAADPERIVDYLDEKERSIAQKRKEVEKIIPQLKAKLESGGKREAEIFEGRKGVENIFRTILSELGKDDECFIMGADYEHKDELIKNVFERFDKERIKKGIRLRTLYNYDANSAISHIDKLSLSGFLPQEIKAPMQIIVWKHKMTIVMWQKKPLAFTINNKDISESFKVYFESLWNQKTKTYSGYEAFKRVWLETQQLGDTLYLIGAKGYFFDKRPEDAMELVEDARKRGMKWKNIVGRETQGHIITQVDIAETRYFKEEITAPGVIWICGNRTMISNWAKEEPIIIVIDNKEIAASYRNYFDILWKMAEK
jgi:sugar-specific transcriptional regulator TrmB